MVLRKNVRHYGNAPRRSPAVAAHIAFTCLLGMSSITALERLVGSLVAELPRTSSIPAISRVEQWSVRGERPIAAAAPAVRGWLDRGQQEKPPIPATALFESEQIESEPVVTAGLDPAAALSTVPLQRSEAGASYRTVCVRLCDGAYFPLSFATTPDRFGGDERVCQSRCGSPVKLFVYRNPGESPANMVDRDGRPYASLASAFRFRTRYDPGCSCKAQPWDQEAQDRHRQYALEKDGAGAGTAAGVELAQIRTRLAALRGGIPESPARYVVASATDAGDGLATAPVSGDTVPMAVEATEAKPEAVEKSKPTRQSARPAKSPKREARSAAKPQQRIANRGSGSGFMRVASMGRYTSANDIIRRNVMGGY